MLKTPVKDVLRTTGKHIKQLKNIGISYVEDLLLYFPRAYSDKRAFTKIAYAQRNEVNNFQGILSKIFMMRTKNGKNITRAVLTDDTGFINVIWFNQPHIKRILHNGDEIILSGKVTFSFGKMTIQSPIHEKVKVEQVHTGRLVPVYPETENISSKWLRDKIKPLINEWTSQFHEYLPIDIIERNGFLIYSEAIKQIHFPEKQEELEAAQQRLSFDELFLLQLKALQKKWDWQQISKDEEKKIPRDQKVIDEFIGKLPFKLTGAQERVVEEVLSDMERPFPMSRLMQGDVGSGKTVVAAIPILNVIKKGFQCALMAPTEILAKQHYATISKYLFPYAINIQFISGSTTAKQKDEVIRQMKNGTVDLVIGTHALIQDRIGFKNLGLAVIDEQHRFGVKQRSILKSFGNPHLLSLSATPIPRTLALTIYGDQDLSIIDEMPKGRQEIITRIVPEEKRREAYLWIDDQVQKGRQAFIICPLIEESEAEGLEDVKAATLEYEQLSKHIFPDHKVGLLHGKMKQKEKDQIMEDFNDNKINILVSTSVVEVGIDVPNASIMIIETAERFGLSQLHQFRGRVGRGEHQSYCFLFKEKHSSEAQQRLSSMVKFSDGFKLAEIDLTLRGPGEIYGVKQSGIPDLRMASLSDAKTIEKARKEAQNIIDKDPKLIEYPKLREKMQEYDEEIYVKD